MGNPFLLYDGVCGLCNRGVQFVLRHDAKESFRFASLQSGLAQRVLARHGVEAGDLDTVYVVVNFDQDGEGNESLLARSDAAVFVLRELGGMWRVGAVVLGWLPRPVRAWGYGTIARNRYRIFGRHDTCPVPGERVRARFLDL